MTHDLVTPAPGPMAPHLLAAAAYLARYSNRGTREGYARDLRIYFDWAEQNVPHSPLRATRVMIQWYVRHLEVDRSYSPAGIQRAMVAVRGMYRTAVMDDFLPKDPTVGVVTPRVVKDPTGKRFLTRHQFADVVTAAEASSPTDLALVHLLGTVGMRVSEACRISVEDITKRDGWPCVRIPQKGRKPALRALPLPVWEAVQDARGDRRSGPLLVMRTGARMTRRAAGWRIERIGRAAGIPHKVHPHELRRTHITLALKDGIDVRIVQMSVGHADPRVTLAYDALGVDVAAQSSHRIAQILAAAS